jgi:large subunit ribosomal protein L18
MARTKLEARKRRRASIRKKIKGTPLRPRLTVFRSSQHIYAQIVDDENNKVVVSASTQGKTAQETVVGLNKVDQAKKIGTLVAEKAKGSGVEAVVFDRNGYRYHGRVLALAKAARAAGLTF